MRSRLSPGREVRSGLILLLGLVSVMWVLEAVNAVDHNGLSREAGIWPRNVEHLWAVLTAPFLHQNFYPHLVDNTIPLVFMGVIIALRGARRLALVTLIVILVSGLGTWLISPGGTDTFGASGLVFGYATYLLARGLFNRSLLEIAVGLIVGVIWGGVLVASVVPHAGVSWQDHVCGAVGGVIAAWLLSTPRGRVWREPRSRGGGGGVGGGGGGGGGGARLPRGRVGETGHSAPERHSAAASCTRHSIARSSTEAAGPAGRWPRAQGRRAGGPWGRELRPLGAACGAAWLIGCRWRVGSHTRRVPMSGLDENRAPLARRTRRQARATAGATGPARPSPGPLFDNEQTDAARCAAPDARVDRECSANLFRCGTGPDRQEGDGYARTRIQQGRRLAGELP